jgi:hypothetical protein
MGGGVKARQALDGAAFPPDVLRVIYDAFDDAWAEVAPKVSARASAVDAARLSLATMAKAGPIDRVALKTAAVTAFRSQRRIRG